MDNFAEQLVKKQNGGNDKIKQLSILVFGILITLFFAVVSFLMLGQGLIPFILLLLAAGAGFGTYILFRNTKVEYEYTYTNGDLDIDKIINKTKRREMLSIQISKFTDFGKYDENAPEESSDMTVVMATDNIASHEYYADFPYEAYGSTRLVFAPDEKMLDNIKKSLPRNLKNKQI